MDIYIYDFFFLHDLKIIRFLCWKWNSWLSLFSQISTREFAKVPNLDVVYLLSYYVTGSVFPKAGKVSVWVVWVKVANRKYSPGALIIVKVADGGEGGVSCYYCVCPCVQVFSRRYLRNHMTLRNQTFFFIVLIWEMERFNSGDMLSNWSWASPGCSAWQFSVFTMVTWAI